jgi:DNA-binding MarR family transcriptional regulator
VGLESLYGKPGYQIRRLRQIAAAIFADAAAPFGITSQQYTTLQALSEFEQLEQFELCDALSLDRSTLATLLVRLEEKGLIRRSPAAHDKRRKYVALTARGRRLLGAMQPVLEKIQDDILAPLAPADRTEFRRMLAQLVERHTAAAEAAAEAEKEVS